MICRSALTVLAGLTLCGSALAAQLPNFDAVAEAPRVAVTSSARSTRTLVSASTTRVQWDDRFGVPTFVWPAAKTSGMAAAVRVAQTAEAAARGYVAAYAPLYGLSSADIAQAYTAGVHDTGRGAIVVKLRQKIGDVPVFRDELNVVLDRSHDLVALSGHISAVPGSGGIAALNVSAPGFLLSAPRAIAAAIADVNSRGRAVDVNEVRLTRNSEAGYQVYERGEGKPIRAKRVYFHLPDRYEPGYYIEAYADAGATASPDLYGYVISAVDGRVLFRNDLTFNDGPAGFSYRVWAAAEGDHLPFAGPQGYDGTPNPTATLSGYQPTFIQPNLITLPYGPISTKDPWLPNDATETAGNNVDAYADVEDPDGFSAGDLRATVNAPLTFDRTYDVTKQPGESPQQQMAAIAQLFYVNNFLHDWYYDAGFNELAGNAQNDNFGRGGAGDDSILAEAQDSSGRNNANMSVPSDGGHPRMQMYVFEGAGNRDLNVTAPSDIAKHYVTGFALFGPNHFDITGDVVGVIPPNACTPITSNVAGKIAFIDRGGSDTCTFVLKVQNAKNAGAIGVIVGNIFSPDRPDSIVTMACPSNPCSAADQALLPALHVALDDANAFRTNLSKGIQAMMHRDPAVDRDGSIDNEIVAHEWMHYMSNRLVADSNGLVNLQSRGMGEGWSDFNAMLMTVRPEDTRFESNATFGGVYAAAVYATTGGSNGPLQNNGTYYGIRRVPYSTDMSKDPLTLKHVMNGNPITGAPVRAGGEGDDNAEVHNTGEVWCTMLWEAYAALLRDTLGSTPRLTFAEAQQRMKEYLVASLKITPPSPTILEARDALLAAALARDKIDYAEFWQAFAKRGAGIAALPPDRYSTVNAGVVEDFNGSGGMAVKSIAFDDSVTSCLPNGVLDAGETGALTISLRNIGGVRLASTTVEVSSSDPALTFAGGGRVPVPATNPGDAVTVSVNASLASGTTGIATPDVMMTITDPQIGIEGGMKSTFQARLNAFDAPNDSATDSVESTDTAWTIASSGAAQWQRVEMSGRDHRWFAPEPFSVADTSLVSPPLMVAPGDFSFSFSHRFAFDFFQATGPVLYIDGGVIEITTDGGKTWKDIGDKIDAATTHYGGGTIYANNGSAIENRKAFEGTSPGYSQELPSTSRFSTTIVNLGSTYAGKRVQIRFRSVTAADHSYAPRLGWEIDDIVFNGIANLPFATTTADRGLCSVASSTTSLAASATTLQPGGAVTLTATVSASPAAEGTVDFFDNAAIVGTARVTSGAARLTVASLAAGTHAITAVFNGSKYFKRSASQPVTVQVNGAAGRRRTVGH